MHEVQVFATRCTIIWSEFFFLFFFRPRIYRTGIFFFCLNSPLSTVHIIIIIIRIGIYMYYYFFFFFIRHRFPNGIYYILPTVFLSYDIIIYCVLYAVDDTRTTFIEEPSFSKNNTREYTLYYYGISGDNRAHTHTWWISVSPPVRYILRVYIGNYYIIYVRILWCVFFFRLPVVSFAWEKKCILWVINYIDGWKAKRR